MILRFQETDLGRGTGVTGRRPGIRCPACRWEPGAHDRWECWCGCVWNTFDTRGVCPDCQHRWAKTQCLRCAVLSPHEDWYEPGEPPTR